MADMKKILAQYFIATLGFYFYSLIVDSLQKLMKYLVLNKGHLVNPVNLI